MSKKEGYVVDLNRMYRYEKDGSFPHPVALMANGKEYYAAFANGSLCYNKAFYQLYLEDTELVALASGEVIEKYVAVSTKTDFDGTKTPVEITDTLTEIQPNYSLTEEKKGTFSVTQKTSNFTLTGTYRQRKDSYHDEYYDLRITYIDCPVIPASGEARPLTVYYSATVIRRYESGKVEQLNDATGSTTSFSSVTVNTGEGASFNHSTGWLSSSNLGTEEKAETVVATVTSVSISAYGMSLTWTGSQQWKQEANVKTAVGDASYNVALTVDGVDEVLWDSTYVLLSATATKTQNYIYTSNPDKLVPETTAATGTVTASDGATVSPTSITGSGKSVRLSFSANSTTEGKTYTATLASGGKKATATVTQQAAKEEYYWETPVATGLGYGQIPASGAAIPIYVNFTQNYIKKIGYNTSVAQAYNSSSVAISLTGSKPSGSTATVSGGTIGATSLGTTETSSTKAQYNITGGKYKAADGETYDFSLTGQVVQEKNVKTAIGDPTYNVSLTVDGVSSVLWSSTYVNLVASATKTQNYIYTSNPDKLVPETTAATGTVTASDGATVSPASITGSGKTVKLSFSANSTTEGKTHTATLTAGGKKATATVTQQAAKEEYYWETPVATGLGYGQIPASGAAIPIYVNFTQNYIKKIGYNTSVAQAYNSSSVAISLTGSKPSGSTATVSGGTIGATSLGTTETSSTKAQYNITGGKYKAADGETYDFSLAGQVVQEKNVKTAIGDPTYNVSLTVDGVSSVLWSSTYVNLVASATKTQNYIYTSNPDKLVPEKTAATGAITASDGATVSPASITGSGKTVKLSFSANSTTEGKTHTATLTAGGEKATATVTQQAAEEEYYWETPVATSLSYGQIPASGAAISIYVNFTQNYIKKIGHNTSPEKVYNSSSVAISLTGSKANNASTAVVSGGTIGASSLGTTLATSTTPQYNITGGTYKAADGETYNFSLTGQVVQATNTKGTVSTAYSVGLSPASHALAASGGTVYFTVSALKTDTYTWSSGSPGKDVTGGTASISATGGTINPNSVYNGGSVSFYKGENTTSSPLSYTVTASYQGKTASSTVTQGAASFTFNYATPGTVGSSGGEYRVYVNSYMNGATLKPTATVSGSATVKAVNIVSDPTAGNIEIVLNIPANTGAARTFTVTVTQPHSNDKLEIKLNQAKYEEQFTLSLDSGAYFKKTDTNTYQFYGTISVESAVTKTVYGDWYYTVINEEGMPMGSAYKDTKGTQTLSITSSTKTISYTGWSVTMNETSSANFAGFRVEFRDSGSGKTYFTKYVFDIR